MKLGFPDDTLGGISSITLCGGELIVCEGCDGIITYDCSVIKLRMCDGILTINGRSLLPECFCDGGVRIRGAIATIFFEKRN